MSDVRIYTSDEWAALGVIHRYDIMQTAAIILIQYSAGMYVKKNRFTGAAGKWLWTREPKQENP